MEEKHELASCHCSMTEVILEDEKSTTEHRQKQLTKDLVGSHKALGYKIFLVPPNISAPKKAMGYKVVFPLAVYINLLVQNDKA